MKRFLAGILLLGLLGLGGTSWSKVSEKKVIAVFGASYTDPSISAGEVKYLDDVIFGVFSSMKRFDVVSYDVYRLGTRDFDAFVKKIQEIRAKEASSHETYVPEAGISVISADDLEKLSKSFIVVVPFIEKFSYYTTNVVVKEKGGNRTVTEHNVELAVRVRFVNVEKSRDEGVVVVEGSGSSYKSRNDAFREAANSVAGYLSYKVRTIDAFRIRSEIIKATGSEVTFKLGSNMGIKPGYEFIYMSKFSIGGNEYSKEAGLLRVKDVGPEYSVAQVLYGDPAVGGEVVEYPRIGGLFELRGGMIPLYTEESSNYSSNASYWDQTTGRRYVPAGALRFSMEMGYSTFWYAELGGYVGDFLVGEVGIGGGVRFYPIKRVVIEASVGGAGGVSYKKFGEISGAVYIDEDDNGSYDTGEPVFTNGVNLYVLSYTFGLKPELGLSFIISKSFELKFTGGYAVFTSMDKWNVEVEDKEDTENSKRYDFDELHLVDQDTGNPIPQPAPFKVDGLYGMVSLIWRM